MHLPVMLPEVLTALSPRDGETYLDGTFGNGGYTEAFLRAADCNLIALDRDPTVKVREDELARSFANRFRFIETSFSQMDNLGLDKVDAVILDVGVSSMQLDQAERGFSFMRSGPLDMRMSKSGPTAADAVNSLSVDDLSRVFRVYGEERRATQAAKIIDRARSEQKLLTTDGLSNLIEKAFGRRGKTHPATRIFQALRIFINDELAELFYGLCAAERMLKPAGRLIVVTFHSLEDRIVKKFLQSRALIPSSGSRYAPEVKQNFPELSFSMPRKAVVKPSHSEIEANPRSRSAKLRMAIRTKALAIEPSVDLLPKAPRLTDYKWVS